MRANPGATCHRPPPHGKTAGKAFVTALGRRPP